MDDYFNNNNNNSSLLKKKCIKKATNLKFRLIAGYPFKQCDSYKSYFNIYLRPQLKVKIKE